MENWLVVECVIFTLHLLYIVKIMSLATRDRLQLSQSVFGWHDFDIERSGSFAKEVMPYVPAAPYNYSLCS